MTQNELNQRLVDAIKQLDAPAVEKLLKDGADPNCIAEGTVLESGRIDPYAVELLFERSAYNVPKGQIRPHIHIRPEVGDILLALIEKGVDPNRSARGLPLISYAATTGLDACLISLLKHGADVNARDYHQGTPLHKAMKLCKIETIKTMVENGADVNALEHDGIPPLNNAAYWGRQDIMDYLRSQGAKLLDYVSPGVWKMV